MMSNADPHLTAAPKSASHTRHLNRVRRVMAALIQALGPVADEADSVQLDDAHIDELMSIVEQLLGYLRPELRGAEQLEGLDGALIVGNHGLMGVDSFALYPLLWRATRRLPRGLGDRALFEVEPLRRLVTHMGAVVGERDNAIELLTRDELVLVYPGGSADSFKGPDRRYRLPWADRTGFIRVAMRAQKPIVPVMGAGIDDAYHYLFHDRWLFPRLFGQGKARYAFPVSVGMGLLPLPGTRFTFTVSAPIYPPSDPALADDEVAVRAFHADVWRSCQTDLDAAMATWRTERANEGRGSSVPQMRTAARARALMRGLARFRT